MKTLIALLIMTTAAVAKPLPVCHFVVATDAPNPEAIFVHENAHCWGWVHPELVGTRANGYKAFTPPAKFTKPYPNVEPRFETMRDVRKICGNDEPFGCQWFEE